MIKKLLFGLIVLALIVPMVIACPAAPTAPVKDKIIIGGARPVSGPLSIFEAMGYGPLYRMWIDDVNAMGGIYVEEYGKKLPIELKIYDDTSDMGKMTRLLEKLMLEDKVDFVLSPCSTAFLFAGAAVFNRYGYILIGAEGGATTLNQMIPGMPYYFQTIQYSDRNQIPVLGDLFAEWGVKSVAVLFIEDLHGIEYSGVATREFNRRGIDIKMVKSAPPDIKDVSPILKEAQALGVDAFCSFTYPDTTFLVVKQAIELPYNPNALVLGPGGHFGFFRDIFGANMVEGIIGEGAWNGKSSPAIGEFEERFLAEIGVDKIDYWGHILYAGVLQFFEQAIVEAGTLDQDVIRDIMATSTFDTVLGPTWYEMSAGGAGGGQLALEAMPGQIAQWQNGVFEVLDPGPKRTAEPIYPKLPWPAP